MRQSGLIEPEIARVIGVSEPTLRKYFSAELEFQPTEAQRHRVACAIGGGMTQSDVALALGVPVPHLRKYFSHELTVGAMAKRAEVLEALLASAKDGNVSAQRTYLSTTLAMPGGVPPAAKKPQAPVVKKGKKEQAEEAANIAGLGTDWEDLIPPAGAIIN